MCLIAATAAIDPRRGLSTDAFRVTFPFIKSADDSRRFVRALTTEEVIVESRLAHGKDLWSRKQRLIHRYILPFQAFLAINPLSNYRAKSASVSRLERDLSCFLRPPPLPHSRRMSVSCANELLLRRVVGGEVSRT